MNVTKQPSFVLIITDSNFVNLCKDPVGSIERLKNSLNSQRDLRLYTVDGRFGVSNIDTQMSLTEIEDKNKTVFSQTLENACIIFDEIIVLTNTPEDPYISAAREVATNNNLTFTQYGYLRRG